MRHGVITQMSGYTKLFSVILDSTVWREKDHVRIVWVTMLAMSDQDGFVESSVPGLADRARVDLALCRQALTVLSSPDEDSRTPDHEGRRIAKVDGGWAILNYAKYRERASAEAKREAAARRQQRKRDRHAASRSVTHVTQSHAIAEASPSPKASPKAETEPERASARVVPVVSDTEPAEPDPGRETLVPLDLQSKLEANGTIRRLAEQLSAPIDSVRDCISQFVMTWHAGKLAGQKRSGWPGRARQWVIDQNAQGKLKPPGAVSHEARNGNRRGTRDEPVEQLPAERSFRGIKELLGKIG